MAGSNVPEEVLAKIVAKLPSKPLARFKSVSKHWNRVISDPSFMSTFRKHRMTLLPIFPFHVRDPVDRSIVNLGYPFGNHFSREIMFVGTFQGVVLVVLAEKDKDDLIILYNPFTGVFKTVPAPPANPRFPYPLYVYGFGYGTTPDDLKIVRSEVFNETKDCEVFSLKNGSWSTLLDVIGDYMIIRGRGRGTFVNGSLYWTAQRNEQKLVVQLDIKNMVFSEIPLPSFIVDARGLDTLDGCLCAFVTTDVDEYGLWAMKEHGTEKSWLKVCLLPSVLGDDNFVRPTPVCILDGGKIVVLSMENQLKIYDISSGSYDSDKVLDALEGLRPWDTSTIEYMETLTSPSDMCTSLI